MFRQHIREIDDNARLLCIDQLVKYQHHIGGANYVSVDSNVWISAHFSYHTAVWNQNRRKKASRRAFPNDRITASGRGHQHPYPDFATALPCYMELDHASQMSALSVQNATRSSIPILSDSRLVELATIGDI